MAQDISKNEAKGTFFFYDIVRDGITTHGITEPFRTSPGNAIPVIAANQ